MQKRIKDLLNDALWKLEEYNGNNPYKIVDDISMARDVAITWARKQDLAHKQYE